MTLTETLTETRFTPDVSLRSRLFPQYVLSGGTVIIGVILYAMALNNVALDKRLDLYPSYPYSRWNLLLIPAGETLVVIGLLWLAVLLCLAEDSRHEAKPAAIHRPHFRLEQLTPDTTICSSVNAHTFVVVETTMNEHHPSDAQAFDLAGAHLRSKPRKLLVNIKGPVPRDSAQVRVSDTSSGTLTVVYGTLRDVQAELQHQDMLLVAQERAAAQQRAAARTGKLARVTRPELEPYVLTTRLPEFIAAHRLMPKLLEDQDNVQGLPRHVTHAVLRGETEHLTLSTLSRLLPLLSHAIGRTVEITEIIDLAPGPSHKRQ